MTNKGLVNFIKEARKRGFDDYQIKKPLLETGWPIKKKKKAFASLSPKTNLKYKNKITIYLDNEVLNILEKRAKKNLMTLGEMIEDILRRSAINTKIIKRSEEKLDDMLITLFSRRKSGRQRKI